MSVLTILLQSRAIAKGSVGEPFTGIGEQGTFYQFESHQCYEFKDFVVQIPASQESINVAKNNSVNLAACKTGQMAPFRSIHISSAPDSPCWGEDCFSGLAKGILFLVSSTGPSGGELVLYDVHKGTVSFRRYFGTTDNGVMMSKGGSLVFYDKLDKIPNDFNCEFGGPEIVYFEKVELEPNSLALRRTGEFECEQDQ